MAGRSLTPGKRVRRVPPGASGWAIAFRGDPGAAIADVAADALAGGRKPPSRADFEPHVARLTEIAVEFLGALNERRTPDALEVAALGETWAGRLDAALAARAALQDALAEADAALEPEPGRAAHDRLAGRLGGPELRGLRLALGATLPAELDRLAGEFAPLARAALELRAIAEAERRRAAALERLAADGSTRPEPAARAFSDLVGRLAAVWRAMGRRPSGKAGAQFVKLVRAALAALREPVAHIARSDAPGAAIAGLALERLDGPAVAFAHQLDVALKG